MRVVALISGGKDSSYNMMQCVAAGHQLVAVANLRPHTGTELDSYMYQSVGHEAIESIATALDLPLYRNDTIGKSVRREKVYVPAEDDDEVEDLFKLLQQVKNDIQFDAVASGAILSDYQRLRVENVCIRLGLVSLAYLWQRDQVELLNEMIKCEVDAIIIKVASLGLEPSRHLGRSIRLLEPHLLAMKDKFGLNVCGEGGEYESLTLDCPLYKNRLIIEESQVILHSNDTIAPVGFLKLNKFRLELKLPQLDLTGRFNNLPIKDSDGYITDQTDEATETDEEAEGSQAIDAGDNFFLVHNVNKHVLQHTATTSGGGGGWLCLANITGHSIDVNTAMYEAMDKLKSSLKEHNHSPKNICSISMFIADMGKYAELNRIYCDELNHVNPPTRACVQVPLPSQCPVVIDAVSWIPPPHNGDQMERTTLHVQSISHWAPANIGPYSQCTRIGDVIHLAGQIGMVPGSMALVSGNLGARSGRYSVRQECQLSLRHVGRLLRAMSSSCSISDVVQGICYLSRADYIEIARSIWEEKTNNSLMDYVVVTGLPKGAMVEWHVWAHQHNHQFEYEETGICVIDWAISIYRRWNYDNNIAAIVCRLTYTADPQSPCQNWAITPAVFRETIAYTLQKLQQAHETNHGCLCALRIFYLANSHMPFDILTGIVEEFSRTVNLSYSFIPVRSLVNENTHLSIIGVRLQ